MRVIDDEGRLFGAVNVIDALVVLVVFAVVVAGAGIAMQSSAPPDPATGDDGPDVPDRRSVTGDVTLDLGRLPPHVASAIAEGDELNVTDGNGSVTLSDVYASPAGDAVAVRVAGRLEANTTLDAGDGLAVGGRRLSLNDALTLRGSSYTVEGRLVGVDGAGEPLDTSWRRITVRWRNVDEEVADRVTPGVEERIAGRTTARLVGVQTAPSTTYRFLESEERIVEVGRPGRVDVRLTVAVSSLGVSGGPRFHGDRLGINRGVTLDLGDVRVSGTVVDVGAAGSASP